MVMATTPIPTPIPAAAPGERPDFEAAVAAKEGEAETLAPGTEDAGAAGVANEGEEPADDDEPAPCVAVCTKMSDPRQKHKVKRHTNRT